MSLQWKIIHDWFRNSATILWARIQYVFGFIGAALLAAFSGYDFTQLASMDTRGIFKMLVVTTISGVVTEIARRRSLPPPG